MKGNLCPICTLGLVLNSFGTCEKCGKMTRDAVYKVCVECSDHWCEKCGVDLSHNAFSGEVLEIWMPVLEQAREAYKVVYEQKFKLRSSLVKIAKLKPEQQEEREKLIKEANRL